jgi:hypothetical protein
MGFDGSHLRYEFTAIYSDIVMSFPENHGKPPPVSGHLEIPHLDLQIHHVSMDWFKGKSTGNHRFSH